MNKLFLSTCIGLTVFTACQDKQKDTQDKPDVLYIMIDDMNDWVSCLGDRHGVHTPNLDNLASKGILFSNAHCSAPASAPSRASTITGVSPSTSGVYVNQHDWRESPVLDTVKTIPEYFKDIGYTAKGAGKLFHALCWIQTSYGIDQNDPAIWDEYYPSKHRSLPETVFPESAQEDSEGTITWTPLAAPETENRPSWFFDYGALGEDENMADYKVIDWAIEQLNKDHDQPLFLGVGIYRPHLPWFAPQEYFDQYPLEEIELPKVKENDLDDVSEVSLNWVRKNWQDWVVKNDQWKKAVQAYKASMTFADAMLGRLIDGLKESGRFDNTIIVLTSDHGMHLGEKEHWEKFTLWERSTRVPLIFVAPNIEENAVSNEPASLLDIFPTLVDLTNQESFDQLEGQLEGESLLPLLMDPESTREKPAITTWQYGNHAIRDNRWRYIHYNNGDEELYDHRNDPNEFNNLAKDPDYRHIMDSLKKWLPEKNAEPLPDSY